MTVTSDYQVISQRSLKAANLLKSQIHEKKAFLAYHALESIGCAMSLLKGLPTGPHISHPKKLQNFIHAARLHGDRKFETEVVKLVLSVSAMRNKLLYPEDYSGGIYTHLPQHRITVKEAQHLYDRVKSVVDVVNKLASLTP